MTDRDDPTAPHGAVPEDAVPADATPADGTPPDATTPADAAADATQSDTASFAPLRGRPVLPRAIDTRATEPVDAAPDGAPADTAGGPSAEARPAAASEADAEASADVGTTPPVAAGSADAVTVAAPPADLAVETDDGPESVDPTAATSSDSGLEPADAEEAVVAPSTNAVPVESDDDPDGPSSLEGSVPLDEPATARRRFVGRGAIAIGTRAFVGVLGVIIAVAAISAATLLPARLSTFPPPETIISPVAAAQQRVCPGPLLRLGDEQGQGASTATSVGQAASEYQATPRDATAAAIAETENTAGVAPQLLTLPPGPGSGDGPTALAGSQSQSIDSGDLVGLATAECAEASGDTWLVGGSTDVGRTTLITLSNPTTVIATVDLAIFGTAGEVVAPGTEGIVVPPGSQRIFSLAGFAPQLLAPVVRVVSRGGLVVANLQQTTVRTLEPGGVDFVGATQPPARVLGIPGLLVSGSDAITDSQGDPGSDDLQTTLRIFVPGDEETTASVTITPARGNDGPDAGDSVTIEGAEPGVTPGSATFELELPGGQVTELPVPGLSDGEYSVSFEAAAPIVAGARVSTLTAAGVSDFAWLPADAGLDEQALVSVAAGPSPVLRLLNPTDQPREVTVAVGDDETVVELEAGEAVPTSVRAGQDVRLTGTAGMLATVTYTAAGRISAFGVTSPGPASGDLVIVR